MTNDYNGQFVWKIRSDMSKEKLCVIIPIYKDDPDDIELISIRNTVKSLDPYPVFFAAPEGIKMDAYSCVPEVKLSLFPARYFESIRSYNNLMLDPFFIRPLITMNIC